MEGRVHSKTVPSRPERREKNRPRIGQSRGPAGGAAARSRYGQAIGRGAFKGGRADRWARSCPHDVGPPRRSSAKRIELLPVWWTPGLECFTGSGVWMGRRQFSRCEHREVWPVRWLCETLDVSCSGFHAWLSRPPPARARRAEILRARIKASFVASNRTYGARRVWHDLLADGASCGLHQVERLMRDQVLRARPRRKGSHRARASGTKQPPMCWTGSSWRRRRTRSGSPTSPTSGRQKAGFSCGRD